MIGYKIQFFRKKLRISQKELGEKVELDQTLISRIERGERKVTSDELSLFAKALEIPVTKLLGESA